MKQTNKKVKSISIINGKKPNEDGAIDQAKIVQALQEEAEKDGRYIDWIVFAK